MKKVLLLACLLIVSMAFLNADWYIKANTHTDPLTMMGQSQPAKDDPEEIWIGKGIMSITTQGMRQIITKDKLIVVKDSSKEYFETKLPIDLDAIMPEQAKQMMSMMKMKLTIAPNGKTKKINMWDCAGYDISMASMMFTLKGTLWASTKVGFDWKEAMQFQMVSNRISNMEGIEEFKKVKGFPIAQKIGASMMGANINVYREVKSIAQKKAPAGIYSVPKGYKKSDKMFMPQMNR